MNSHIFFGTYKLLEKDILHQTLQYAYNAGYRHFDCAELYKNQHLIGEFFTQSNIPRKSYFLTSKLSFRIIPKGEIEIRKSIEKTLNDLQTNYIDLMIIHAPVKNDIIAWRILTEYKNKNIFRNIGLSNYNIENLENFMKNINNIQDIYCNQIEFNPFLHRTELIKKCKLHNIKLISYGNLYKSNKEIENIAEKLNKTKEQILLKYALLKDFFVIVTATNEDYIKNDIDLNFTINVNDIEKIDNMNENFSMYKRFL
jgi:diketogulonate reductase-like aldo/keto reductase